MTSTPNIPAVRGSRRNGIPRVIVATTALLSFISFWRAAAIVLNDLASSAYYAGGEDEGYIGKAAPTRSARSMWKAAACLYVGAFTELLKRRWEARSRNSAFPR